jgi:hypothetical protein
MEAEFVQGRAGVDWVVIIRRRGKVLRGWREGTLFTLGDPFDGLRCRFPFGYLEKRR